MNKNIDFKLSIAGVGGQGVLTLSSIIVQAAKEAKLNITAFTRLRSAMRLGPVLCDIRINDKGGFYPSISPGTANVIIGLEPYEGGIIASQLVRNDGYILINSAQTPPINNVLSGEPYPDLEPIWVKAREHGVKLIFLDAGKMARTVIDNHHGANFILLGVLAKQVGKFPVSPVILRKVIGKDKLNLRCFELGYRYEGK